MLCILKYGVLEKTMAIFEVGKGKKKKNRTSSKLRGYICMCVCEANIDFTPFSLNPWEL